MNATHQPPDRRWFTQDPASAVWLPQGRAWDDNTGTEASARSDHKELVAQASERSSLSRQIKLPVSGPGDPALNTRQTSLLRPFVWDPACRVLEVGARSGTMTRFLAETFSSVTAIEPDPTQAAVAAERLRDLRNVSVLAADFGALPSEPLFDLVFVIGSLGAIADALGADVTLTEALEALRRRLSPTGTLVLAVENRFGLKYFSGMSDDHTGKQFDGIEGYQASESTKIRAVARTELATAVARARFRSHQFFYPFPDYTTPRCVVSEDALTSGGDPIAEFIAHPTAKDNTHPARRPLFDQRAAWHQLVPNGLGPQLANAFLVFASATDVVQHASADWAAAAYNLLPRRPAYWAESKVYSIRQASARMVRSRLNDNLPLDAKVVMPTSFEEPWTPGTTIAEAGYRAANAESASYASVASAMTPWFGFLRKNADDSGDLPGRLVDAIPQNMIAGSEESPVVAIDQEFSYGEKIPLTYVVARGLIIFFSKTDNINNGRLRLRHTSNFQRIRAVCRSAGIAFGVSDAQRYVRLETFFLSTVNFGAPSTNYLAELMFCPPRLRRVAHLVRKVAQRGRHAEPPTSTRSAGP